MSAPEVVRTTVADLLARAIAEVDNGNISAAADNLGVSRQTVYGWLDGVVPQRDEHIDAIISYTGEDEVVVLLAMRESRRVRDERAASLRNSNGPGYPGSPGRVLSFSPRHRPSLTVCNRALPVSDRVSTGASALEGAA